MLQVLQSFRTTLQIRILVHTEDKKHFLCSSLHQGIAYQLN